MEIIIGGKSVRRVLESTRQDLTEARAELQMSRTWKWVGTDTDDSTDKTYKGNYYETYEDAVKAIVDKYEGTAEWGVLLTGNIIEIRSALIMGNKLELEIEKDTEERDKAWAQEFMSFNDIDKSYPQECVKESEIEGRILFKLFYDPKHEWNWKKGDSKVIQKEKGMVKVRFLSWEEQAYKVEVEDQDYLKYEKIIFDDAKVKALTSEQFVYRKIGGRVNKPNKPVMKVWRVLTAVESLDRALRDLRLINNLFAGPVPDVQVDDMKQAKAVMQSMGTNWKKRRFFVHVGEFSYKSPDSDGTLILIKECAVLAKVISGSTGIPIHYLGFTDEMSNRATAESLVESMNATTQVEREITLSAWNEVLEKASEMQFKGDKLTKVDSSQISFAINVITQEQWERIEKVYLPLKKEDLISLKTLLSKVPGIDVDDELERLREEAEGLLDEIDRINKDKDIPDKEDDEQEPKSPEDQEVEGAEK